jgi:polar amino acid transport system ATP-binding protein
LAIVDPEMVKEVLDVIGGLAEKGLTLVIVTHEMGFARRIASRVLFLDEARIVEDGRPEEVLGRPKEKRVRDFLAKVMPN